MFSQLAAQFSFIGWFLWVGETAEEGGRGTAEIPAALGQHQVHQKCIFRFIIYIFGLSSCSQSKGSSFAAPTTGVAYPHHNNADPDPSFYLNADPDPTFYLNADPDPALHQRAANLTTVLQTFQVLFDPGIRNRFFPDPGSQTHIFESLVTIFWVKSSKSLKIGPNFFYSTFY
jgi:hypothetical protein